MLGWVAIFSVVRGTGAAVGAAVAAAGTGGVAAGAVVLSPAAALAPPGRAAGAPPPEQAASDRASAVIGPSEPSRARIDPSSRSPPGGEAGEPGAPRLPGRHRQGGPTRRVALDRVHEPGGQATKRAGAPSPAQAPPRRPSSVPSVGRHHPPAAGCCQAVTRA